MLFSISYVMVLLGLIAVIHAIPVDSPNGQTAPSHPPPHAVSLLDPRRLPPPPPRFPPRPPKDEIYITFMFATRTGEEVTPVIEEEITLIFTEYRRHLNVDSRSFRFLFQNGYDGDIRNNLHDVMFWGEGVGRECQTRRDPCKVQYKDPVVSPRVPRPDTHLATVFSEVAVTDTTDVLFNVGYETRNCVSSESGHPVPVSNERSTSNCKVM
ncbi:hypothetical protein GGU10DRAFT_68312 [Lentinula aff. detonsa]|uniref:Secreted protein n=1 Tax=Lentinula aff. detonsa TaxID=2804958 RepID=A0AA38L467_9AGAR|nr:hypothetical protein GGU10DRAFT_68312 [Lentinula aff. detonsa]